jgi:RNA polymerase sigma-70 factor
MSVELLTRLRARWPEVSWDRVSLATGAEHDEDLCLAAACLASDPAALRALDAMIRRASRDDEVQQTLRMRLLLGEEPRLKTYAGRGALSAWLRLVARRVEVDQPRDEREVSLSASRLAVTAAAEVALVRESSKKLLVAAIERALNSLGERDRLLIVAQTFEGATHEALAKKLGAPRSTITAWLAEARGRLSAAVKADLAASGLEEQELQSMVRALGSSR